MEKQGSACRLSQITCTHTCQKNSLARHVLKPACPWNRLRRSESSAQRPARLRPVPWLPASLAAPGTSAPSEASCSAAYGAESGPLLWGGGSDMSPLCLACCSFACSPFWFWSPFLFESWVHWQFIHDWVLRCSENCDVSEHHTLLSLICHSKFEI